MKALHKYQDKKDLLRVFRHFFEVRGGHVYATDAHSYVKAKAEAVFGSGIISEDEKLYFRFTEWQAGKFDKATVIERDGMVFKAYGKNHEHTGTLIAITEEQLIAEHSKFPDINVVIPKDEKGENYIYSHAINIKPLTTLMNVLGDEIIDLRKISDAGPLIARSSRMDEEGTIAGLMPYKTY